MLDQYAKTALQLATIAATEANNKLNSDRGKIIGETNFIYTHPLLLVPATSVVSANINIGSDADFDNYSLMAACYDTAGVNISSPYLLVQIVDQTTGRAVFSEGTIFSLMAGSGSLPFILNAIRQFKARSSVSITYQNLAATNYYLQTAFNGTKVSYESK